MPSAITYQYFSTLETIEKLLETWPGFQDWTVLRGTTPPQPDQLPVIQVRESTVESIPKSFPGWMSGNRELTVQYRLYMAAYHPDDLTVARQQLQNGWDQFELFLESNSQLGGTVDWIERFRVVPDS